MKTLKHGFKVLRVLGRWAWRSWCRSSRSGRSWWSRRRRNISWSSPCLPCPFEVNCQIIHIPTFFLNVGQVNGRAQVLIGQTVRGNSSSSAEGSDQGWKSEPRGVTLSNGRNLTWDKGYGVHVHVRHQAIDQPSSVHVQIWGVGCGS